MAAERVLLRLTRLPPSNTLKIIIKKQNTIEVFEMNLHDLGKVEGTIYFSNSHRYFKKLSTRMSNVNLKKKLGQKENIQQ